MSEWVKSLSRMELSATPWTGAYQAPPSMEFSRQEYWSGLPLPSPAIFPTQESNQGLLHCRQTLLPSETPEKHMQSLYKFWPVRMDSQKVGMDYGWYQRVQAEDQPEKGSGPRQWGKRVWENTGRRLGMAGEIGKSQTLILREQKLGASGKDPLEEEMATHSSIVWRIHGQRSLVGYSPWGCRESEMTEVTQHTHIYINPSKCLTIKGIQ